MSGVQLRRLRSGLCNMWLDGPGQYQDHLRGQEANYVSIQKPVPRYAFDRIIEPRSAGSGAGMPTTDVGIVWFDAAWATRSVEGILAPPAKEGDEQSPLIAASPPEESHRQFVEKAREEGWDGPIFSCPGCRGVNPCGMLLCLHCRAPFLFRLHEYPEYLVSPMAKRIVAHTAEKCCPEVTVPDPVRRDTAEVSRVTRYGVWTGKMSLVPLVRDKLKTYFRWQRRWYRESDYFKEEDFRKYQGMGYSPYCPGPVCSLFMENGLYVDRAPATVGLDGSPRNNQWYVYNDQGDESLLKTHSIEDLDPTSRANFIAIQYANDMFVERQNSGRLDAPIQAHEIEMFYNAAYRDIFGVDPAEYYHPDRWISWDEHGDDIIEVQSWGRSVGHSRIKDQAQRDERDAIAAFTNMRVPSTPAEAAGGRANQGGYHPYQPGGKGKSSGRSAPYPQAASSSSSGSGWRWSTGWSSWSGWQGNWSSRGWWH